MHWYTLFALMVLLLWLFATAQDRRAALIVLCATLASWLLTDLVTAHFTGAWKLVVPGCVEVATAFALLRWAPTRSGYQQVACVSVAWLAHLLCFTDIHLGTNMVYDNYEGVLMFVAALQVVLFYDTYLHHLRQFGHWWNELGADRAGAIRGTGFVAPVLRNSRTPGL